MAIIKFNTQFQYKKLTIQSINRYILICSRFQKQLNEKGLLFSLSNKCSIFTINTIQSSSTQYFQLNKEESRGEVGLNAQV